MLTVATISEPLTFNLALARDAGSSGVLGYLFEGLTQTSWLNDEIEPLLARSWERSDDGLRWVFHLRDDVQWHDGTPLTAHDVEFTFNRVIYNDDFQAASRASFEFRFLNDETGQWEQAQMTVSALDDLTVSASMDHTAAPVGADDGVGTGRPHRGVCPSAVVCSVPALVGHCHLPQTHP